MNKKQRYIKSLRKKIERNKEASCDQKRRYSDINSALAGAMSTIENVEKVHKLYYYKCDICKGYHLTKLNGANNHLC